MPPVKPDIALVLAASAAASFAVAAAAGAGERLEDVQIGENGRVLRVALICSSRCEIVPGDGESFRLVGVGADLDVDLSARSALASRLAVKSGDAGSVITIDATSPVAAARVVACRSDSGPAPCIEYRFEEESAAAAVPAPPALRDEAAAEPEEDIPFIGAVILAPQPSLRDGSAAGLIDLPQFAPPERLSAPAPDGLGDIPATVDVGRPSLIAVDRVKSLADDDAFDFKAEAAEILGKRFDVGACEGAKARLLADAWALQSMIDSAYCKAGNGKLEEADADLARLLAYTPDNYEALVGRGLIALASGERKRGKDFLQEALNALPPIEESDRIVAAMRRN